MGEDAEIVALLIATAIGLVVLNHWVGRLRERRSWRRLLRRQNERG